MLLQEDCRDRVCPVSFDEAHKGVIRFTGVRQPVYVFRDVARSRVGFDAFFCQVSNPSSFRLYCLTRTSTIVFVPRRDPKACASQTAAGVRETEPPTENIPRLTFGLQRGNPRVGNERARVPAAFAENPGARRVLQPKKVSRAPEVAWRTTHSRAAPWLERFWAAERPEEDPPVPHWQ
jgi:hypothetical protein